VGDWHLDPYHTQVEFSAKHLGMMTVRGHFADVSARIAYGASTQINRKDFGLNFSMVLDGRFVVSDEIQVAIEGELVETQQETATAAG
jgi:polyisoprenoid-binding protein YceI